ncbi:hypothetical protein [Streptomyces qinglanensis]|uniref:Uncharacterized protein n=1 Tax=Streptomyces qinglanensis TaxID=943816 RepID=A0A1H9WK41_9ACTN|nr:hypothetical protein [Streptomyces qinglanensis]SES34224.1 hypothetical protein SAMN05421870_11891 [Streptomyces qinglanensis]
MSRFGLTIDVCPRELPFCLTGAAIGLYGYWQDAFVAIYIPMTLLLLSRITVRRWRSQHS